ncbi:MAG: IclR family transcriptional regulator [Myxococcota bacterium]
MESLGTVDKAVDVLFALHGAGGALGVTALARSLGWPKSSTHRLLATLARRGLVERSEGGRYRPGVGLLALGLGVRDRDPLCAAARPVLEAAAGELGETVFLVDARGGRLRVLDEVEGRGFLRAAPRVGEVVPAHATAVGKLFLAFAPDRLADAPDAGERFTAHTPRSRRALARAVDEARSRGFAENRDEWIDGRSALAAPVFARGELRGALALAASSPRFAELGARVRRCIVGAADRVGARLEGRDVEVA